MNDRIDELAEVIWTNMRSRTLIERVPAHLSLPDKTAAYAVQARLETLSAAPRVGWKIAATSAAGQSHIGVDGPLAGRILSGTAHPPGATLSLAGNSMCVAEAEFAFRLRDPLGPRSEPYATSEIMEKVAALHLAIELPDSRFANFATAGLAALIADNACGREFVVGPAVTADWRTMDLARHPVEARVGDRYRRSGSGANVLGDPRLALTWCINEVTGQGLTLEADELISTGTCVTPLEIEPGDTVIADFGLLGEIAVNIAD